MKKLFSLLALLSCTLLISGVAAAGTSILFSGSLAYTPEITTGYFLVACMTDFKMSVNYAFSSPVVFDKGICRDIQTSLNSLMGSNAPSVRRTPVGYLQALMSPTNRAGLEAIQLDTKDGKKHMMEIIYTQRGTEEHVKLAENNGCTPEFSVKPYSDVIEITNPISLDTLTFSEDQMRRLCTGDTDLTWMTERLYEQLDGLSTVLNKQLITIQGANFGNFANGSPNVTSRQLLNVIAANNKVPNAYGEVQIFNDLEDVDYTGRPIMIGSGKLREYTRLSEIGCCNNNGIDNSELGDFDYFNDRFVGGILGNADDFITLMPGNVQLMTFNKYNGQYVKKNDSFKKFTIVDPYTGLEWDIRWKYDDCNEVWMVTLGLMYELYFMPTDAFRADDPLNGVNGTFHYRATQA